MGALERKRGGWERWGGVRKAWAGVANGLDREEGSWEADQAAGTACSGRAQQQQQHAVPGMQAGMSPPPHPPRPSLHIRPRVLRPHHGCTAPLYAWLKSMPMSSYCSFISAICSAMVSRSYIVPDMPAALMLRIIFCALTSSSDITWNGSLILRRSCHTCIGNEAHNHWVVVVTVMAGVGAASARFAAHL